MQILNAHPRDHLTAEQVTALLLSSNLQVDFGAELLDLDLGFVADISDDLVGGSVAHDIHADIHGTCEIQLSRQLLWGVDLVKPYMVLSDGSVEARWNLGVYCLTTPERAVGETPETFDVQGYDRLMLLDRQVGEDYEVLAGTTYRQALLDVFDDAGLSGVIIEGSAADDTLPADKVWLLVADDRSDPDQDDTPATWLRVVNDLLRAINFRAVWCDQDGQYRCESYTAPSTRGVEFTFDANDGLLSIVGDDRVLVEDVWATPNKWVFRQTNRASGAPTATEGDGIYTVTNTSDGPTSIDERGLIWPSVVDYEAASQDKLVALGDRHVAQDLRAAAVLSVTTGPFPPAGHADVFAYVDDAVGFRKVQAVEWEMPMDGGDMTWTWERV